MHKSLQEIGLLCRALGFLPSRLPSLFEERSAKKSEIHEANCIPDRQTSFPPPRTRLVKDSQREYSKIIYFADSIYVKIF